MKLNFVKFVFCNANIQKNAGLIFFYSDADGNRIGPKAEK